MKPYYLYMLFLAVLNITILATPYLMASGPSIGEGLHAFYSLTCHQIVARSYCLYPDGSIADCPHLYSRVASIETSEGTLYKFPVCARDLPLYLAAFLGGIAVYFTKWRDSKKPPNPLYFVLALVPIAFDGGTQFVGLRESTNGLRAITGIISGFAFSFYFIPMLNSLLLKNNPGKQGQNKEKKES
ncbi:DUF2085 domain-containing protein [Candidatus Micrarchaeota archaeon]|nr:DUF2085 domain-containing protein [Candidatus Micrarchaeota archaeon]MBD3417768.1 DUF2085 domain-containing protein [Candidatus Micrarchaeota archaeon]